MGPSRSFSSFLFFFFNDTATTEIYTLSLHDALPISTTESTIPPAQQSTTQSAQTRSTQPPPESNAHTARDRKSTRLNSSHQIISYAVFCLKKKKKKILPKARCPKTRHISTAGIVTHA